jgi:hypothetical protein
MKILEDYWTFIFLVKGLQMKVWLPVEGSYDPMHALVCKFWIEKRWIMSAEEPDLLTSEGKKLVACQDLWKYEFLVSTTLYNNDYANTNARHYEMLRKGLGQYFKTFIKWNFIDILNSMDLNPQDVFDLGCGDGTYSLAMQKLWPKATFHMWDKPTSVLDLDIQGVKHVVDLAKPVSESFTGAADVILLSEVIHCLSVKEMETTLDSCQNMLKVGGTLLIVEQNPSPRMSWRMEALSNGGRMYSDDLISFKVRTRRFDMLTRFNLCDTHYILAFRRI